MPSVVCSQANARSQSTAWNSQLLGRVAAGGDRERGGAARVGAVDVVRRVADDHDPGRRERGAVVRLGATDGERQEVRARLDLIVTEGADGEVVRQTEALELHLDDRAHAAAQHPEGKARIGRQASEQRAHAGEQVVVAAPPVPGRAIGRGAGAEDGGEGRGRRRRIEAGGGEHAPHELAIELAVEIDLAHADARGRRDDGLHPAVDGLDVRRIAPLNQRAVDVEQDQPPRHARAPSPALPARSGQLLHASTMSALGYQCSRTAPTR
ncbi:MAG: hypothetical protein QJR03_13110 [Sphaerobacter sp.]|nr:hypothetical protein [Sphaerobacter sp.]